MDRDLISGRLITAEESLAFILNNGARIPMRPPHPGSALGVHPMITYGETDRNGIPFGCMEVKLFVAMAEDIPIIKYRTKYHHVVDDKVVTSVDETKPTYYYTDFGSVSQLDAYAIAMEFYIEANRHKVLKRLEEHTREGDYI